MIITSAKIKDLEAALRTFLEASSWMDWWLYTAKSMACMLPVKGWRFSAPSSLVLGLPPSSVLNQCSSIMILCWGRWRTISVLSCSWSSAMPSHSAQLSCSPRVPQRSVENLSWVLHDEAIQNAVWSAWTHSQPDSHQVWGRHQGRVPLLLITCVLHILPPASAGRERDLD